MKVLILGGFLGSGKTTILMQLATYLTEVSSPDAGTKVVILENEVGQKSIDDKLIKSSGFSVQTLFNGCICCSLSGEVIPTVIKIEESYHPEWLIIETTGLAYPGLIQDNLKQAIWMDSIVCTVVDSSRWKRFLIPMHDLLKGQIECADIVLMNKSDLVDKAQIADIEQDIRQMIKDGKQVHCYAISALQPIDPIILNEIREVTP